MRMHFMISEIPSYRRIARGEGLRGWRTAAINSQESKLKS